MFIKICVIKSFAIFTGKHLCWSLCLIKLQACRPATLLKGDSYTGVFFWKLRNFWENLFKRKPLVAASACCLRHLIRKANLFRSGKFFYANLDMKIKYLDEYESGKTLKHRIKHFSLNPFQPIVAFELQYISASKCMLCLA